MKMKRKNEKEKMEGGGDFRTSCHSNRLGCQYPVT